MTMMTDFIHALSHFHKIWAVCDKSPKGDKSIPGHTPPELISSITKN